MQRTASAASATLLIQQMLLDPFKKQFDAPPALVESDDGQGRFGEIVGEKHQRLAGLRIAKADAPGLEARQDHGLPEEQARVFVPGTRVALLDTKVVFSMGDEEGRSGDKP